MKTGTACILAALWLWTAGDGAAQADRPAPVRALFIGNSLTYANDLPGMIEALASQAGLNGRVVCRAVARSNFGLEEHWNDGEALNGLDDRRWTHVVLQQGPSSRPESRTILRSYTKKFAFEIRRRGAKTVMYGVWPARAGLESLDEVTESYALAAADAGGTLVPVGEGRRAAWRRDPAIPLYAPDAFHPSPIGTYLAALMFFEHFTGRSPVGLPAPAGSRERALRHLRIDAARLLILQEAAAEAAAGAKRITPL
ncbi:MAG TPA: hypothetical protein VJ813_04720 [Vicinamibacterales bacterium]|nr:hypothetical protein [Vicinamibacterales bacterium]